MQLSTRPLSRRWRKAYRCLLPPETAELPAAIGILAPPLTALASLPLRLHPIMSPSEEPISPIRRKAPTILIGVRPTAKLTDRRSRTFRRFPGTNRARDRSWLAISAFRRPMVPVGFVGAARRRLTDCMEWLAAVEGQARAQPAFRQRRG